MNDEIQYRCAGFIQAEIERYAEELEAELPSRPREPTDDENETGNETTGEVAAEKEKKGRAFAIKLKPNRCVKNQQGEIE